MTGRRIPAQAAHLQESADQNGPRAKFSDPDLTTDGQPRAHVPLRQLETLWLNTGTLCNITCESCYIASSPRNDRLAYLSSDEVRTYLDEISEKSIPTREIGITGGEPFMNPDILEIIDEILTRGFELMVLTNAMRPMQRHYDAILALKEKHADAKWIMRVSVDHYSQELHEQERGPRSWSSMAQGLKWLSDHGFDLDAAGRTRWGEEEHDLRRGYSEMFERESIKIDAADPRRLVLFPEMDEEAEVPEITAGCWDILDKTPNDVMCSNSRMVVKRRGADAPVVLACTLIPYDERFEMGSTLAEASAPVPLNHPHCAKFCVLGGGACS